MAQTQTFLLAGVTSYADPGNWNNSNNVVQAIGPGGSGSLRRTTARGGFGGGGGAHAGDADVTPTFPVATTVSAGGAGAKTSFGTYVIADFGVNGTTSAGGTGGSTAGCTGTAAYLFAGGAATYAGTGSVGGGGAGAAGPKGAGQAAATTGGAAGNGTTAPNPTASVAAGVAGRIGTQWDASHGSGSGAGGATLTGAATGVGLIGGAFGGGGSGCHSGYTGATLGAGGDGLIAITYEDFSTRNHVTNSDFAGAAAGVLPLPNQIIVTGTGVTASVLSRGTDTNGLPMITVQVIGSGSGTSTTTRIAFGGAATGSNVNNATASPSVPNVGSLYVRIAAGATTGINTFQLQSNCNDASSGFTGTTFNTSLAPTGTIGRITGTGVNGATTVATQFSYLISYTAAATFNITLEFSGPQLELGDTASAVLLTPVRPYIHFLNQLQPILAQ